MFQPIKETEWYQTRPLSVQKRIDEYPDACLYYNKRVEHQVMKIYAYEEMEDGSCDTCKVLVLKEYNPHIAQDRLVFGVPFEDLELVPESELV